jgi:hypothetical protein
MRLKTRAPGGTFPPPATDRPVLRSLTRQLEQQPPRVSYKLNITTDGPIAVTLPGCNRIVNAG